MKPQCTTAAQCLKELARVMDQFGIADIFAALRSKYCKWSGGEILNAIAALEAVEKHPDLLTCAIAEVEGKPVFIGDELYYFDRKIIARAVINGVIANAAGGMNYSPSSLSWNPPKPKTVMVELPYDYVVDYAGLESREILSKACKLSLEKLDETNTRTD